MRCPTCNDENPEDAVFCGGCGNNLSAGLACPSCMRANTPGVRFCHGCGVSLAVPAAAPNLDAIEKRFSGLENDLADLAMEVASLVALKEQLQEALEGMRKRATSQAPPPVKPATPAAPPSRVNVTPSVPLSVVTASPASAAHGPPPNRVNGERIAIWHFEDQPAYQDALRALIEKFGYARYCLAGEPAEAPGAGRRLFAINLLLERVDPLGVMTEAATAVASPSAFTYCGDGARGFTLGMVDFFPPPFEPNLCVTALLERPSPAQRLLVVSDAVDATSELRRILTRLGCATSVAFDGKQALNLLPMVRPDVILIDLNLPKGDALRVIGRVRADAANVNTTFALMWQTAIAAADFRQQAAKAAKDLPFPPEDLRRAMGRELGPGGAAYVNTAARAA